MDELNPLLMEYKDDFDEGNTSKQDEIAENPIETPPPVAETPLPVTETQPPATQTGAKYKWVPPARKRARKAKPPLAKKVKTSRVAGKPQGPQPSASTSVPSKLDEDSEIADFKKGRSS